MTLNEKDNLKDSFFECFLQNLEYVLNMHKSISQRTKYSIIYTLCDGYYLGNSKMVVDDENGEINSKIYLDELLNEILTKENGGKE